MELAERVCKLECVEKANPVIEFVGPVKIVLVDTPERIYRRKTHSAGLITLANMMIGATTVTVIFFTLSFELKLLNNLHVALCTIGYQFCVPTAILMFNSLNGATAPLKLADRKCLHLILQCFGIVCAIIGSVLAFLSGSKIFSKFTIHSVAGITAGVFAVLSIISGLTLYITHGHRIENISKKCHNVYGIFAFVISSVCFIMGILKPKYKAWIPVPEMSTLLIVFCVIYTIVVIFVPATRLVKKINYF